jgi:uncharacterized protein (UPF0332 family)
MNNKEENLKELIRYWLKKSQNELVSFEERQVEDWLRQAELFVEAIKLLVKNN